MGIDSHASRSSSTILHIEGDVVEMDPTCFKVGMFRHAIAIPS